MKENEGREGLTTSLAMETLEDRNAAASFGWLSFGGLGKLAAFHAPKHSHHDHHHHWSLPSISHWAFGWHHGHGCKGHQPPASPPPASPPPASPPPAVTQSVSGVVYHDFDQSTTRDDGEPTQGGRLVWVDSNNNGVFDTGVPGVPDEVSTTSAADGSYTLTGLPANTTLVILSINDNETTSPGTSVTLDPGQHATGVNVGLFLPPS